MARWCAGSYILEKYLGGRRKMLLYIVRHGIAIDREDPKCPSDPERYLTPEGLKKTREVAKGIASFTEAPKLFISSPYVRAFQTAEILAEACGAGNLVIPCGDRLRGLRPCGRTEKTCDQQRRGENVVLHVCSHFALASGRGDLSSRM